MIGAKTLEVSQETMCEILNSYLGQNMPKLGVATRVRNSGKQADWFTIELAERQSNPTPPFLPGAPPVHEPDPPEMREPNVRVMRMEGVK